jgi:hypothetical protein
MKITVDIVEYDPVEGIEIHFPAGGTVKTHPYENGCTIEGDRDGLITLATALMTIAHNIGKMDPVAHIHVDKFGMLSEESSSFVVQQLQS